VAAGRSADAVLAGEANRAVRAVTLGTLRWYLRLLPAVESLLARHSRLDPVVRALLLAAAHQIEYSRNPPELSVDAAVNATRALGCARARGLVNAVLRRFTAERAALFAALDTDPAVRSAHPAWLYAALRAAWPAQVEDILAAANAHPPLTLRVDLSRSSRGQFLARLGEAGIEARVLPFAPAAVVLPTPVPVQAIPGFADGLVSVQDAGAQLAAPLLAPGPGMRVLDACAAPGGKTLHLLELAPGVQLTAADADAARLGRVRENLVRARREAALVVADTSRASEYPQLAAAGPFERILVDAPCSGTGVIRRHPDIKLLRRAADAAGFAALQLSILRACFALLAPGGRLLYCTCSLLPAENEQLAARFLAGEPAAAPVALPRALLPPGALERPVGVQLLPGTEAGTDGFYYACLEKSPTC